MKNRIAPLAGGLLCATALTLSAQTFTEDTSGTPAVNTFNRVDGLPAGSILFNNVEGGFIADPYQIDPVGVVITEVTTASGTFTALDICAQMFVGPNSSSSYSVSSGFGSLTGEQQTLLGKLFSNTLTSFFSTYEAPGVANRTQATIIGAAIQLAFWEIVEDPEALAPTNLPSLDENTNAGEISISGYSGGYTGGTLAAMELAQTYLTSLNGWSDSGGNTYFYAENAGEQDRFWVVPEPSTALLGMLGMTFFLRRKRA
jgi:hypothetical protein